MDIDYTLHRDLLMHTAKSAIARVYGLCDLDAQALVEAYPFLGHAQASFVTLNLHGNLRGCIGSLMPQRSLIEDLCGNAVAAAFRDTRFEVLRKAEFDQIDLEISLLSMPQEVTYDDAHHLKTLIKPHVHGVIVKLGDAQSTFLPSVWENLESFEVFMGSLLQKAGLSPEAIHDHPNVFTYTAQKIS